MHMDKCKHNVQCHIDWAGQRKKMSGHHNVTML